MKAAVYYENGRSVLKYEDVPDPDAIRTAS